MSMIKKTINLVLRTLNFVGRSYRSELPFIFFFMLLMGTIGTLQRIHGHMVSPDASISQLILLEHLGLWFVMASIMIFVITVSSSMKSKVRALMYGIVLSFYLIQQFLEVNFGTKISATILTMIAETNPQESKEFLSSYLLSHNSLGLYSFVFLIVFSIVIFEKIYSRFRNKTCGYDSIIGIVFVTFFLFGIYSCQIYRPLMSEVSTDALRTQLGHVAPQDPFTCLFRSIKILHLSGKEIDNAVSVTLHMKAPSVNYNDTLKIVLVIGESYIKHHASIYGYPLETTPRLKKLQKDGELFVFKDVVTPYNSTSRVLKNLFSCNSIGDYQKYEDYPYFPAIFKQAGYDVFLWDNQHHSESDTYADFAFTLDSYMYNPKLQKLSYSKCNQYSFDKDLPLISNYEQEVVCLNPRLLLSIFHLQGQHVSASSKYPHEPPFTQFTNKSVKRKADYLSPEKKQRIAEYDNATYYNDSVIGRIINIFRNDNSVVVYFSDHGDEIYDYRDQYGREHNPNLTDSCAHYEFEIPFMVWCSNKYRKLHPEIIESLKKAVNRPFMIDNISQMLFTLGYIVTDYYNESRDILSSKYKCPPRILQDRIDYDKLMRVHKVN